MSQYLDLAGTEMIVSSLKEKINAKMDQVTLAAVATSGSYGDLNNKPTIPTVSNTYSATSSNAMSGVGVKNAFDTYKGVANGVASLDDGGKVPAAQLPSFVDDVVEYANKISFPTTGETGKIYIDKSTNLAYRWSGSSYVEIAGGLALGETSSTAYPGDKGKANADAIAALATVASTGSYNDLSNKPTIPAAVNEATVSGWGFTKNVGTVTKVNNISPTNGNVTISIPTVTDTYSATSSSAMSGKALASALGDYVKSSDLTPITTEEILAMLA